MIKISIADLRIAGVTDTQIVDALQEAQAKAREQNRIRQRNQRARNASHRDSQKDEQNQRPRNGDMRDTGSSLSFLDLTSLKDKKVEKEERLEIVAPERNEFAVFWNRYPHKVGKRAAAKSFQAARTRAKFDIIAAGLARYAAKTDDRPWCNPATWLNQDRWDDQPGPVQQRDGKSVQAKTSVLDFTAGYDARTRQQLAERAEIERQRQRTT